MAGGEIVPAAERGLIECAEWVGPAEDMKLGFHQVFKHYYMPSLHEPAVVVELLINGKTWDKLAPDLQEIVKAATMEATIHSAVALNKANATALKELREKHNVQIGRTPNDILIGMLKVWDKIAQQEADKNPFFKKVRLAAPLGRRRGDVAAHRASVVRGRRRLLLAAEIGGRLARPPLTSPGLAPILPPRYLR